MKPLKLFFVVVYNDTRLTQADSQANSKANANIYFIYDGFPITIQTKSAYIFSIYYP